MSSRALLSSLAVLSLTGCDAVFGLEHAEAPVPIDAAIDAPIAIGWKATAAGEAHSCGIRADDTLWCWGSNSASEIGVGSSRGVIDEPTRVGSELFSQVSSTSQHTCAIALDGGLWCWGTNVYGQLGNGNTNSSSVPQRLDGTWKQVSAGIYHTCAIRDDSTLWCWGYNYYGEVGIGTAMTQQPLPAQVGTATWLDVDAGLLHTCGIQTDHSLWCWGNNSYGQFGNTTYVSSPAPTVTAGEMWLDVEAGSLTTCGRTMSGALRCWGYGVRGQLGNGTSALVPSPQPVATEGVEAQDWLQVSVDDSHACGVRNDGSLWCWGLATHAQIGAELADGLSNVPIRMTQGSETWRRVDTGASHTCAVDIDSRLWCFGAASSAQLGNGDNTHATPSQMPGAYVQLAASATMTCGLEASTTAPHCAGSNDYGQLGDGTTLDRQVMTPIASTLPAWTSVAVGQRHACATTDTYTMCWGDNEYGQLGDGTFDSHATPASILGYVFIAVAADHTCGLSGSTLYCWGFNLYGQVGNSSTSNTASAVSVIPSNVVTIAAGFQHSCAINDVGTAACWGRGFEGQLGNGTATYSTAPVNVETSETGALAQIEAGSYHTCAIATDRTLYCWGSNYEGALGQGDRTLRYVPVRVGTGLWSRVAAGSGHTCGIATNGSLWCWGRNTRGQLGLGTFVDRYLPGQVGTDVDWVDVVAGSDHTCASKAGGLVWCWGANDNGQVFDGSAWRSAPVQVP